MSGFEIFGVIGGVISLLSVPVGLTASILSLQRLNMPACWKAAYVSYWVILEGYSTKGLCSTKMISTGVSS